MSNAQVVDGNKVLVELEWEQIDAIVRNELRDHVLIVHKEMMGGDYVHPDDVEDNKTLIPALLRCYEYWAGKENTNKLKQEIGYEIATD